MEQFSQGLFGLCDLMVFNFISVIWVHYFWITFFTNIHRNNGEQSFTQISLVKSFWSLAFCWIPFPTKNRMNKSPVVSDFLGSSETNDTAAHPPPSNQYQEEHFVNNEIWQNWKFKSEILKLQNTTIKCLPSTMLPCYVLLQTDLTNVKESNSSNWRI